MLEENQLIYAEIEWEFGCPKVICNAYFPTIVSRFSGRINVVHVGINQQF
jgi:hypothetical protein